MTITRGRATYYRLTNKSGVTVTAGQVVVTNAGTDSSFTTTTTSPAYNVIGTVWDASILNNADGLIQVHGDIVPVVAASAAVTRGDYIKHGTTAGKVITTGTASGVSVVPPVGSIGVALTGTGGAGNIVAFMFGNVATGATSKNYDPDLAPPSPSATNDEFDDDTIGAGWTSYGSPDTLDETTLHGFLHIADNDATTCGVFETFVPGAAAFTVAWKCYGNSPNGQIRVGVWTSAPAAIVEMGQINAASWIAVAAAIGGGFTTGTFYNAVGNPGVFYGAITRDATTNYTLYVSQDGIIWNTIQTFSQAGTVGRLYLELFGTAQAEVYFDFVRTFPSQTTKIGNTP